jgi:hypothetical protein
MTDWEVVRNIVGFLWMVAIIVPYAALDGGEVVSVFLFFIFVLPLFLYFLNLYKKYKKTNFKSFDAYFHSIQKDNN